MKLISKRGLSGPAIMLGLLMILSLGLAACGDSTATNTPFPVPAAAGATAIVPAGATTAAAGASGLPAVSGTATKTASGLQIIDNQVGTGAEAKAGANISVNYTGYLTNGTKFDSSVGKTPFSLKLGAGQVIKGWDEGLVGMKVGGKRRLLIPPALGYGASGSGSTIPPNADLVFDVELLDVKA